MGHRGVVYNKQNNINLSNEIRVLENETMLLKRLRMIRNELLSNGAYHTKNLEEQIRKFEALNVNDDEINLVKRSSDVSSKLSYKLMKKYNDIIDKIEKHYL